MNTAASNPIRGGRSNIVHVTLGVDMSTKSLKTDGYHYYQVVTDKWRTYQQG